ncbi:hypothetical protein K144316041_p20980 (plasmid) [Clostridium tetani]|uniref:hypothetical protein n=1 Tax=Clostridium tetani TaxID=1513 RepID=UPI002955B185|nr:hypothetical protein [Clostridium tetani]BDR74259.1 hypothetical protein K144316041_p20980 [Clostridium tetani]
MKVKQFISYSKINSIDTMINKWINENSELDIINIKYSTLLKDHQIICSALVIYKFKTDLSKETK